MKHANSRLPRILLSAALLAALGGAVSAQAVGIQVGSSGATYGSSAYGGHLGAYKAPWKGKVVKAGSPSGFGKPSGYGKLGGYGKSSGYGKLGGYGKSSGYGKFVNHCPPPAPARVWVAGCWRVERERVWVAGAPQQVWVQPVYATKCNAYGATYQVLVTPGHYAMVPGPGCWTVQPKKVWVPGHWVWS